MFYKDDVRTRKAIKAKQSGDLSLSFAVDG